MHSKTARASLDYNQALKNIHMWFFPLAAPKIKTADQDLEVDAGQPLTMVVPYYAYPKAEAEWFKENEPLSSKTVDTTAEQTSFRILKAKKGDKGRYKIVLQNKHGKAEGFINLKVIGKPLSHLDFTGKAQLKIW